MMSAQYRVERAVEDSIREGGTVTLEALLDSQDWVDLSAALDAAADDWQELDAGLGARREYRGVDGDGDAWAVILVGE